jgi:hypothetical protein
MTKQNSNVDAPVAILAELEGWQVDPATVQVLLAQTARSLETVTKLTQYEDEKANRLLSAIAFISAFVASLFATIPSRFPPGSIGTLWHEGIHARAILLGCVYLLFCAYSVLVGIGVAMIVHAVRPRFEEPKAWKSGNKPKSLLFFQRIIEADPTEWVRAFSQGTSDELSSAYIKNSVFETHLIATKIQLKVKWLKRGVSCFFLAALVVIALVCTIVLTLVTTTVPLATSPH